MILNTKNTYINQLFLIEHLHNPIMSRQELCVCTFSSPNIFGEVICTRTCLFCSSVSHCRDGNKSYNLAWDVEQTPSKSHKTIASDIHSEHEKFLEHKRKQREVANSKVIGETEKDTSKRGIPKGKGGRKSARVSAKRIVVD